MNETNLADKFYYRCKIGKGSFGEVWEVVNKQNNKIYAAKDELLTRKKSMVVKESGIYSDLELNNFGSGLPAYYGLICTSLKNVLIIERLGDSLESIFLYQGKYMSGQQISNYGKQMIILVSKMHKLGYIHRDIKPQNFISGINENGENNDKLYICDFGLAKKYIRNGTHIKEKSHKSLVGTARYVSVNIHNGIEPSRRDDLISILHIIIYLHNGSLPWQEKCKTRKNSKNIFKIKRETSGKILCRDIPKIGILLEYCYSLSFNETPDYNYIIDEIDKQFVR